MSLMGRIRCLFGVHEVILRNETIYFSRMIGKPIMGQCIHCGKYGYVGIGE